jgi:GNAT superfamily N-acetyltransferase
MEIRPARIEDAAGACQVLRRSISGLCVADHHNDPAILLRWLANKTQEIVASWIAKPGNTLLLAVEHDTILRVGSVTNADEVTLNYVSPDARFRGVSRAMIGALEDRARRNGNERCHLTRTETARGFYHRRATPRMAPQWASSAPAEATQCPRHSNLPGACPAKVVIAASGPWRN